MAKNRFMALVALAVLSLGLVMTVSVSAQEGGDTPGSTATPKTTESDTNKSTGTSGPNGSSSSTETAAREAAQAAAEKAREAAEAAREAAQKEVEAAKDKVQSAKEELQGDRLKACEAHQDGIKKIMSQAGERGTKQITLFSTIASRVEAFYTSKGNTLSNYAQLVANVNTANAAAQSAVQAVTSADVQFNCGGTNPTGQIDMFRAELKAMSTALEQYRLSVKNLIVGVKSVQSTTTSGAQQ